MSRFLNPFPQFLKLQNGALQPNSSGTLTFYVNGTSTLADVWTDYAKTIPANNPQTLDSNGRPTQNLFMDTDLYRVRLADSNDATIWDKSDFAIADQAGIQDLIDQLEALIETVTSDLFSNNYVINGGMQVDQLGTASSPVALTTSYVANVTNFDCAVLSNVSAGTAGRSSVAIGESGYTLHYSGVSCSSAGQPALRHRIYSANATNLSNKDGTISLVVKHDVGANVNYTIATYVANAQDNFAAVTSLGITSTTAVATATATTIQVTGAFGDVDNGVEIIVYAAPAQALTTKNFYWSDYQYVLGGTTLPFRCEIFRSDQANSGYFDGTSVNVSGGVTAAGAVSGATVAGAMVATQANMETGTATNLVVTPGRQPSHPGHPKAWALVQGTGIAGAATVVASYNVTSATRQAGTGQYTITWDTNFTNGNYCVLVTPESSGALIGDVITSERAAGTCGVSIRGTGGSGNDPDYFHVVAFGDQA